MAKTLKKLKNQCHANTLATRFWGKHTHIVLIIICFLLFLSLVLITKHFLKEIDMLKQVAIGLFGEICKIKEYLKTTLL